MKDAYIPNIPTVDIRDLSNIIEKLYIHTMLNEYHPDKPRVNMINIAAVSKPGIGKTESIANVCERVDLSALFKEFPIAAKLHGNRKGIGYRNVRLGQVFPPDFKGNPYNQEVESVGGQLVLQSYSRPSHMPNLYDDGEFGILVLDEFNQANPTIGGMAQQLLDSGKIGNHNLGKGWVVVSFMNLRAHGAHVQEVSMPNASRMSWFNVKENLNIWFEDYAYRAKINPWIISYLKSFPNHFYVMPRANEKAYACPRTWSKDANKFLNAGLEEYITAAIGESIGTSFLTFYKMKANLPDWDLVGKPGYKWSYDQSDISLPFAVTQTAISLANPENIGRLTRFIYDTFGEEYIQIFVKAIKIITNPTTSSMSPQEASALLTAFASCELKNDSNQTVVDIMFEISQLISDVTRDQRRA